ncbi:alpha/beta fold hydrolase [Streptomyces somaliensis]|uniref:alpha/beta fold hydrolase n=1 Tax=Streptomyces somaliensis TaxID=78355 RepID=UPI0020CC4AC1|nr:alpha/beta fold hydrolase [Streptomyces somaliensis]MCP9943719.1 alpha/beta fold hydrolase [Streptomyces somaliensis]
MFEPLEGSVRSKDGTRIAYERSGTGPALIMVDPAGRYRELGSYRSLAKLLAQHFTVFVYDRRGRGASSDRQPYALEREIDDLAALIEAAGGSAFVYAMTSGALLALHAAAADLPIPALAVFEPPIRTDDSPGEKRDLTGELAELIAQGERAAPSNSSTRRSASRRSWWPACARSKAGPRWWRSRTPSSTTAVFPTPRPSTSSPPSTPRLWSSTVSAVRAD